MGIEEHREETDPSKRFTIQGVAKPDKLITDFWNLANDANKVSTNLLKDDDVQVVSVDGVDVIAIHVPRADYHLRPIYINDNPAKGTFRRNHEGDYHCQKGEIASMYRDANDDGNDGVLLRHYTMADLDYVDKTNLVGDMRYSDRFTYDFSWENNIYQFIKRILPRLTSDLSRPFVL